MTAIQLLKQVDQLNENIAKLEKEKQDIYQSLSLYKKIIEKNNEHLIGRKAMCIHIDNPNPVECTCNAVKALEDYSSVRPLFSRKGRKYIVETYEWVEPIK
jgi:hypothetical protein